MGEHREHHRCLLLQQLGCTGWRPTVAVHEDNIFDEMIAAHPEKI
jgi:hypothetical protein